MSAEPSQDQTVGRDSRGLFQPGNPYGVRFSSGVSGNPGGRKRGVPSVIHAIERIIALSPAELKKFKPSDQAEVIALRTIKDAAAALDRCAIASREMIVDRIDGPVEKRLVIDTSDQAAMVREAKTRFV